MKINAIILAAGKGTRMKSQFPKVIHKVMNKPMIMHVVDNLTNAGVSNIVSVVGYQADLVKDVVMDRSKYVYQNEQLGTAHAIVMAQDILKNEDGLTIIICGDTPLISSATIEDLINTHIESKNDATILSGQLDDALMYGRIIKDDNNLIKGIVEYKDADEKQRKIKEFNTGTYIFDNQLLFKYISEVKNDNIQKEYYLTDIISIFVNNNLQVGSLLLDDLNQSLGINDRKSLAQANEFLQKKINDNFMMDGVTIIDPKSTYIDEEVKIGKDTIIHPNTYLYGKTIIGENNEIGPNTELVNTQIKDNNKIIYSHIHDSTLQNNIKIGPYVRIRQNCVIEDEVKLGNFVELKNAKMDKGSKSAHLSYLGDSIIGKNVNIGCGTITVNYDGQTKSITTIEDDVFVGCNSNLIAPVTIKANSMIAAGSTITEDVPKDSLAIARQRQTNKIDYYKKTEDK